MSFRRLGVRGDILRAEAPVRLRRADLLPQSACCPCPRRPQRYLRGDSRARCRPCGVQEHSVRALPRACAAWVPVVRKYRSRSYFSFIE